MRTKSSLNRAPRVAVFGSGIAGLSAAAHLSEKGCQVDLYELEASPGGLTRTIREEGFLYDLGPHFLEQSMVKKLGMMDQCFETEYLEQIHVGGKFYRFPLGLIRNPRLMASLGTAVFRNLFRKERLQTLHDFFHHHYGEAFATRILDPLVRKWSGEPSARISIDFAKRLDPPGPAVILHHLKVFLTGRSYHAEEDRGVWMYPREGAGAIARTLLARSGVEPKCRQPIEAVLSDGRQVTAFRAGGRTRDADAYVSTLPLFELAGMIEGENPLLPYQALKTRSIILVYLRLAREQVLRWQWVWFPEPRYAFYRLSEPKNIASHFAPPGKTLVTAEMGCQKGDREWLRSDEELGEAAFRQVAEVYGLPASAYEGSTVLRLSHAYPVMHSDKEHLFRERNIDTPLRNLFLAGRFGIFHYLMLEESYDSGIEAAKAAMNYLTRSGA